MRNKYQRKVRKSNQKFEIVRGQELMVRVPLPMAEVWAELQAQVEELTGQAGLQILRAILENEVTRRVGPPASAASYGRVCALGKAAGFCGFCGTEEPAGTAASTNPRRPGSRTAELRSIAARRKTATSRAGAPGGGTVHAELSASGAECGGRLWDREKQCEPAVCRRQ